MSKNKENRDFSAKMNGQNQSDVEFGSTLTRDLAWVLVLNGGMLGLLLVLYYFNNQSQFIENWFLRFFNF